MGMISGLYYKLTTIVNYASSVVSEQSFQLIDYARVIIYDRHVFIVQAVEFPPLVYTASILLTTEKSI